MENYDLHRKPGLDRLWITLSLIISLIFCGCQAKEASLSPAAAFFKKEMKECIGRLATPLIGPVAEKNVPAIQETLSRVEPQAIKLCRLCPFRIGVLDRQGDTLATYPLKKDSSFNFSSYDLVAQTLKNRKTAQQRFFLQDGSEIYIIAVPLIHQGVVIGLLAISLSAAEAQQRWGLTEKEFLALDFNT